jgi:hypothetical protein
MNRSILCQRAATSTAVLLALAQLCMAQTKPETPPPAAPKPIRLGSLIFTGSLRSRVEAFDWFQPSTPVDNAYGYSGNILRFGISQKKATWDWNTEFAVPFLLGLPANATAPAPQGALGLGSNYFAGNNKIRNAANIFPKQAYIHIAQFGDSKANQLKLGRFEFLDGSETAPKNAVLAALKANRVNQRLIGSFGWSDVGRSFDGAQYSLASKVGTFTVVGAVPTRGVFQTDGWGWNRTAFGYSSFARSWGKGSHAAETRIFAIYYDDFRHIVKTDNRSAAAKAGDLANIRIWTFGGNSLHLFTTSVGSFDTLVWGLAQTGKWGVQNQSSWAFLAEGGYQPKILPKLKPWLRGGYSTTSGDSNPNDKEHNTFVQLLPTPRPYARFPFFNMMNNIDRSGSLTLRPHAKVTLVSEYHSLSLHNANDLWYSGGGVFQPWSFGYTGRSTSGRKSLVNLYDTSVEYRLNPRLTFTAYYGYAQGLAAMRAIYPAGQGGSFGYLETLIRF